MRDARILVLMKTYIGDAVMAAPMLDAIEAQLPSLAIQSSPIVERLLQDPIKSRRFLPYDARRHPWAVVQHAMRLRRERFDVALVVNRSFRSALVAALAGIRRRIGHISEGRRMMLTDLVPYDPDRFEAETYLDLARVLDCDAPPYPRLIVTTNEQKAGRDLLEGAKIGIQPGARYPGKSIPVHTLASIVNGITEGGVGVALLGGPEEADSARGLELHLKTPARNLVGQCDLRLTLGTLKNLSAMIGADTGLMHMAAAVSTPTVTVFGPTSALKWGHRYAPHKVIALPSGVMSDLHPEMVLRELHGNSVP